MTLVTWRGTWNGRAPDGIVHQRARSIVRPTGGILRGKFPSRKNGRLIHHEGMLELAAIYHFETSPLIARYTEQPQTIHYADGSRLRRYTPDFELFLTNGRAIYIEVKPEKFTEEPSTKHKLLQVNKHFERRNQSYVVLTEKLLQPQPRLSNLRQIYHQAPRLLPSYLKCSLELRRLSALFPLPLGEALTSLSQVGLDPYSLLMMGLLTCELSTNVTENSVLTLVKENDDAWFRLSDRFDF
ncbi:transposase [Comamonas sp. Z1]|uniref:TnsA endonuclease N-terminal domain-containing protein n=1 Tax=Comamonas sp. Z1 TaxID=2601246 RepID=UPI0011E7FA57|nr:TnsA endonuclease N-terminal domain-containing protein [Comamonas sp. Z1]TYK72030.1 transposase [Comamonas sp. Z1]